MMQKAAKIFMCLFLCFSAVFFTNSLAFGSEERPEEPLCAVYITGIGCGNCAVTDPVLFVEATRNHPRLILFEYEIYRSREENLEVKDQYFKNYIGEERPGVPFLIFSQDNRTLGRYQVLAAAKTIKDLEPNAFPKWDGSAVPLAELDLTRLPGAPKIWTKDRVLIHGEGGDDKLLKRILLEDDLSKILQDVRFEKVEPEPVVISRAQLDFEYAVKIGHWRLQWNGEPLVIEKPEPDSMGKKMFFMLVSLMILAVSFTFFRVRKTPKGAALRFEFRGRIRDFIIAMVSLASLVTFFFFARNVTPDFLEKTGYDMPLPLFTFLIALVDGFNPCNMFVLTCLLALLISTSDSRKRLYAVALSFVAMVYVFYFMFMALWLNVFKYISFINPLRIGLAVMAILAGLINCKELFFFRKGITLMIQDSHKDPLMRKMDQMKEIIQKGSFPLLITSSLGLAALASLVELPCTAGFPIIYTGILAGKGLKLTTSYYVYLMYYNLVYVLPLLVIVSIFVYTLKARKITQRQMEIIKFIGGIIMLLLGIVLLVNPGLLGLGIG